MFLCLICAFTAANLNAQTIHTASTETELRDAITTATAGDIIDITADITLTLTLNISKNLSIRGNDHTIDGDGNEMIYMTSAELEIENLNLINGSTTTNGGGVTVTGGTFTASNCTFENNSADNNGGAVLLSSASATFIASNCTFENNSAVWFGGAVYMSQGGTFEATECTFKDNTAGTGGAVYMGSVAAAGTFEATECTFDGNTAGSGGAVYMNSGVGGSNFDATECTFKNNSATNDGGAVYMSAAIVSATECIFESNSATNGGAVYSSNNSSFEVSDCTFDDNTANIGGAVYSTGASAYLTVSRCTFKDNTTNTLGGAVYVSTAGGTFTADECIFDGNIATTQGGAVYINSATAIARRCTFKNNSGSYAGAVSLNNTDANFTALNSTFYGNSATNNGGAVNLTNSAVSFTALNSTFYNNTANNGGAINVGNTGSAYLFHSTIVGNKATTTGGGVWQQSGSTHYTYNCLYVGNEIGSGSITEVGQYSYATVPNSGALSSNNLVDNTNGANTITLAIIFGTNTLLPEGYIVPLAPAKRATMISGSGLPSIFAIPGFATATELVTAVGLDQAEETRAVGTCPYVTYGSVESEYLPTYNLTVNIGAGGGGTAIIGTTGTTTTESGIECGTSRTITAIPDPCYTFDNWTGPSTPIGTTTVTLTMVRDSVLTANFTPNTTPYTLTLSATGSGTVVASPAKATYSCGDVVTLTATPLPDHRFVGWDDGGGIRSSSNPHNITIGGTSAAITWDGVFEPLNKKMRIKRVNVKKGRLIISPQP